MKSVGQIACEKDRIDSDFDIAGEVLVELRALPSKCCSDFDLMEA